MSTSANPKQQRLVIGETGETRGGDVVFEQIGFDLPLLMRTRLLLAASSGAGKSETIRKICEVCSGKVQIIVLDPEGEFADLRATMPFVLAGPGGDAPVTVKVAGLLAQKLLELNASAICDLFELPPAERHLFVRDFLAAMIDAPKDLWHPVLVIVDEAHLFAPEKGDSPSPAANAMADMAGRGRKRGFCLVMATQRLARLNNNTAALCENVLIGRTGRIDQDVAAKMLNIVGPKAKDEFGKRIGRVGDGQFYAWGRAFGLEEPTLFQVQRAAGERRTSVDGARPHDPPPAPAAIRDLIPRLAELPQEAERLSQTIESLTADLAVANRRIRDLEAAGGDTEVSKHDKERIQMLTEKLEEVGRQFDQVVELVRKEDERRAVALSLLDKLRAALAPSDVEPLLSSTSQRVRAAREIPVGHESTAGTPVHAMPSRVVAASGPLVGGDENLSGPARKILGALSRLAVAGITAPARIHVCLFSGSGNLASTGFVKALSSLRTAGFIDYPTPGSISVTPAGLGAAPEVQPIRGNEELFALILTILGGPETKILTELYRVYPKSTSREHVMRHAGYSNLASTGFVKALSRLRSLGYIDYVGVGQVVATEQCFLPKGVRRG